MRIQKSAHDGMKTEIERNGSSPLPRGEGRVRGVISLARVLRRGQTDTEKKLWYLLRGRELKGFKFRRQFPIGPYIADFCCWERRLVVELDGGQHAVDIAKDKRRTLFLNQQGYKVIRFWDNEVLTQTASVLEVILEEL